MFSPSLVYLNYIFKHYVEVLSEFFYSICKLVKHSCDHLFELFIRQITYVCFIRVFPCSFIWDIFFCLPFLFDFVCFYDLDGIAISTTLERVILYRGGLWVHYMLEDFGRLV